MVMRTIAKVWLLVHLKSRFVNLDLFFYKLHNINQP